MICLQTPSFGWSFQDGRQLASKPIHHNEFLDAVVFLRSVVVTMEGESFPRNMFLSDKGPTVETLDFTIHIG